MPALSVEASERGRGWRRKRPAAYVGMLAEGVEGLPVMRAIALVGAHEPDPARDLAAVDTTGRSRA